MVVWTIYNNNIFTWYSLHPKMIVWLYAWLEIEAQSQIISHQTFYIKKSCDTATFGGNSKYSLFQESYLQLFGQRSMVNGP